MKQTNHLSTAHASWSQVVSPGDLVVDATCGNGHDTLFLTKIALTEESGTVLSFDIQPEAIESAKNFISLQLNEKLMKRVNFIQQSHARFPKEIPSESVSLIVYNLGYLPGGDKTKTTMTKTTLQSIKEAMILIRKGGLISITCYPGHEEGQKEEEAILELCSALNARQWICCHHRWINRKSAPSLLLLQKQ